MLPRRGMGPTGILKISNLLCAGPRDLARLWLVLRNVGLYISGDAAAPYRRLISSRRCRAGPEPGNAQPYWNNWQCRGCARPPGRPTAKNGECCYGSQACGPMTRFAYSQKNARPKRRAHFDVRAQKSYCKYSLIFASNWRGLKGLAT